MSQHKSIKIVRDFLFPPIKKKRPRLWFKSVTISKFTFLYSGFLLSATTTYPSVAQRLSPANSTLACQKQVRFFLTMCTVQSCKNLSLLWSCLICFLLPLETKDWIHTELHFLWSSYFYFIFFSLLFFIYREYHGCMFL